MIRAILLTTTLTLGLASLPQTASAHCNAASASSASVSCTQGVQVVRQSQGRMPTISPTAAAQMKLKREKLAIKREQMRLQAAQANRRLDQEDERIRNQGYLYRDARSPLRQRSRPYGYGSRGFRSNTIILAPGR